MQHDDVIWGVIGNKGFCSHKAKINHTVFCRNEWNMTGLCNRTSCPLANSRYTTVKEENGVCYLYMKTIERAHTPANLWERVKLSEQYSRALEQINEHLMYWPKLLVHRAKQRYTKIYQYLVKARRLKLRESTEIEVVKKK
eukprot:TRINITY_DN7872_c0_g1_i1.p1 TRINITY_DN7872_c0_g1~~TRINITY_DN7872_c0_g1_i1.p1  ORF type:complete len:141 (-),score=14.93 TRINITY_DN7872_c0_g1_i1:22-444(-)